ncbi:MAG: hypothetical protein KBT36_10695 [Kurthia sp.]|nr:hypothetical protein [Candidatus Kurthia equi]
MKKFYLLIAIVFCTIFVWQITYSQASIADKQQMESPNEFTKEIGTNQGELVFSYKPDFEDLCSFLGISKDEYFKLRKSYSMLEIAQKQNIEEGELFNYLVSKRFQALNSHYNLKKIDLYFIMNYTLRLKEDVKWEMTVKKIN